MIDVELLKRYMNEYFGYGHLEAPIWFIGMEEGGGSTLDENFRRINLWKELGQGPTTDLREFHARLGMDRWTSENPKIQATWSKLIRLKLAMENPDEITTEMVREYQARKLAQGKSDESILELMPLPSPSISDWFYGDIEEIPFLKSRDEYFNEVAPIRARKYKEMIATYSPRLVVCYGSSYIDKWQMIAPELEKYDEPDIFYDRIGKTQFVVIKHPANRSGSSNAYYENIGRWLAS